MNPPFEAHSEGHGMWTIRDSDGRKIPWRDIVPVEVLVELEGNIGGDGTKARRVAAILNGEDA